MLRATYRTLAVAVILAASAVIFGCSQGGGHTRGMFAGQVIGKTEAEVIDKYGPPARIDRANEAAPVITYTTKTFDPDNENRTDPETVVYFEKDKDGKVVATAVSYRG